MVKFTFSEIYKKRNLDKNYQTAILKRQADIY